MDCVPGQLPSLDPELRHTEMVTVDGMSVRVSRAGEGPPLLLIGGLGNDLSVWDGLVAELEGIETIAVDAPGTGGSDTPCRPLTMAELARFYVRLLRALGVERSAVCGLSFGGAVAQQLAFQAPDVVDRLVLCGTGPGLGGYPGSPFVLAELAVPWRYYSAERMRRVAKLIYGGRIGTSPELLEMHLRKRLDSPPSIFGYYFQLAALTGWSSLPWLGRLTQPTLIIAGEADPVFPLANAYLLAEQLPDARVETLPGAGHLFVVDSAAQVARLITEHLRASLAG